MKNEKRHMTEGMEQRNQENIESSEKKKHKYLGIVEADAIKQEEMKEKMK